MAWTNIYFLKYKVDFKISVPVNMDTSQQWHHTIRI